MAYEVSADPYAGSVAANGKEIWTPEEAADNLNRLGVNFTYGNYGAADDGVLTYGFWTYEQFLDSYYFELRYSNGEAFNDDAYYAETFAAFEAFTAEQQALAAASIELWDDLISIDFVPAAEGETGDIMFGAALMSTAAGAHAYYPQAEALDNFYGTAGYGQISGDVMINWYYNSPTGDDGGSPIDRPASTTFSNLSIGSYAWFAMTHELGHSLGLAHGGDYNASNGPATYDDDAYFFQDSQQYTIMSYFSGRETGQAAILWHATGGTFVYAQTPAVHDILAVQNVYGADYSTRSGDTVYGFNSTAENAVFDFSTNIAPIVTIWDGGGNDTLDLSGFDADNIIDINEGAFSSAGFKINAESLAYWASLGIDTQAELDSFFANNGIGPDGRPIDNIAIAYGAQIENAIGGSGDDVIIGNALDNMLVGGDGNDFLIGGLGKDDLTGGEGADTFVFEDTSKDKIRDFESEVDTIDLSAFEIDASAVKIVGSKLFADTDGNGSYDFQLVVQGDTVQITDIFFG